MNDEQKEKNQLIDEKDELKDSPKDPYVTSASVGGFIGAVAGYVFKNTVVTNSDWPSGSLFVGGAAIVGSLVAMGFCYIWVRFMNRFCE